MLGVVGNRAGRQTSQARWRCNQLIGSKGTSQKVIKIEGEAISVISSSPS
jgi:hypothetical protein